MEKRWAEKYIGNDYVKGSPSFSKIVVINGNIKRLEAQDLVKNFAEVSAKNSTLIIYIIAYFLWLLLV